MVDINLIGDDQTQFDNDDNEKDFQDTYSSDADELTQDAYMRGDTIDNADYARVIRRGGSKAGVFVLFIVVVALLAVTAYLLFKPGKTPKITQPDINTMTTIPEEDSLVSELPVESQIETPAEPVSNVSPGVREKLVQTAYDINAITQVVNTIPADVIFTLVRYNDGNILLEVYGTDKAAISDLDAVIKQKISSADLRILTQDVRNIKGRQYFRALLNGNVQVGSSSQMTKKMQSPKFLTTADLKNQMNVMSEQFGLKVKQFDAGLEKVQGEFNTVPITFRAYGLKGNIINLLQQILTDNLNVSYVKIALIANDSDISSPYLTLVLNLNLYRST